MTSKAVLSVDFEFFRHTPAYRNARGELSSEDEIVGTEVTDYLIQLFNQKEIETTFFVVSEVAETSPELITKISKNGHEIASHTHTHRQLPRMNAEERLDELAKSRDILSGITNKEIRGFRAPAFNITDTHFNELEKTGYSYDSSIVPSRNIPGWYGGDHKILAPKSTDNFFDGSPSSLLELPVGVMPYLRLPLTGAWIRFFGVWYTLYGMELLNRRGIAPVLYVHPWELVEIPKLRGIPKRVYWRTGDWMRRALEKILNQDFEFVTAERVLQETNE